MLTSGRSSGESSLILIDELDGISGRYDRGAASALLKFLETSSFPIIMTANNPFDKKFKALVKKSAMIEFQPLSKTYVASVLQKIVKAEGVNADSAALESLAWRAGGDLRGAITDLQLVCAGRQQLTKEDIIPYILNNEDPFQVLFKSKTGKKFLCGVKGTPLMDEATWLKGKNKYLQKYKNKPKHLTN